MTSPEDLPYTIEDRELIAEAPGLRVQILTLGKGEDVPWHYHTEITDTIACLQGPMVVKMPSGDHEMKAGDTFAVAPTRPTGYAERTEAPAASWWCKESAPTISYPRTAETRISWRPPSPLPGGFLGPPWRHV